jgi:hypothetical protein
MKHETPLVNFVTFQLWVFGTVCGLVVTLLTGDPFFIVYMPWVGFFVGVVTNELMPGFLSEGLKIK